MELKLSILFFVVALFVLNGDTTEGKKLKKAESGKEKKAKILNGNTAEASRLPMILECDLSYPNILLGSITIDGKDIDKSLQKKAEKECIDSLNSTPKAADTTRTCSILLADAKMLVGNETFRAIYQCNMGTVENWDKGNKSKTDKSKTGKDIKMKCKGDEYLKVVGITINESEVELSKFPELHPEALEWECSKQKADEIKAGKSVKGNIDCKIYNKPTYGGELEIQYKCKIDNGH
ncbi:uncharacterized protein LOC135689575 [Rhopilema esculentum]|uniref:uncharacterized protein LOC135689575 n=1 Tax=Rhopilema esculentum TaxID=499914 RepID=UPI0031D8DDEF|eukprot:gene8111-14028_t